MGSVARKVGGAVKGAVGGLITGGPMGAITGGLGGLFQPAGGGDPQSALNSFGFSDPNGGGFMNWLKGNAGTLGGLGLAGATLLGRGNPFSGIGKAIGSITDPRQLNDPRQQATNDYGSMLSQAMAGGNMADFVTKMMGPAYGGQLNAGADPGQLAALGGANSALANFYSGDQGASTMNAMNRIANSGFNVPPEIAALLGQGGVNSQLGQQIQQMATGVNPAIQNLLNMNNAGPGVSELSQLFNSGQANALLGGGVGQDLGSIGQAISAAQQPALDRRMRDLREQFSFGGLGQSTNLNDAAAQMMAEAQTGLTGQLAQIAPQLASMQNQTSLGALQAMAGIGGQMGNINTGSQQAAGQLINQANLGGAQALSQLSGQGSQDAQVLASILNNQNNAQLQAALAQPGAFSQLQQLGQNLAQTNFNMNTTMQNQNQADLTRQYQAWQQQQSLMPNIMQYMGSTGPQQYQQSLLQQLGPMMMAMYGMKQAK